MCFSGYIICENVERSTFPVHVKHSFCHEGSSMIFGRIRKSVSMLLMLERLSFIIIPRLVRPPTIKLTSFSVFVLIERASYQRGRTRSKRLVRIFCSLQIN